ncbi:MAG: hypothetical protein IT367_20040 [Candidatus Hydrogenedentes bacterium]|nr:hypothetical protein [Candidatus Hydrogenedentota bacterium]
MNINEKKIAAHFDGQTPKGVQAPSSPEAQAYIADLNYLREGARAAAVTPQISDAQFASFMDGIRQGIDATPARGGHWLWAKLSLVGAALVVAISVFVILESKNVVQPPVTNADKVDVETVSTDIRDVTVQSEETDDGNAVVWMTPSQVEVW